MARQMMAEIGITVRTNDFSLAGTEMKFADGFSMRNDFTNVVLNPVLGDDIFDATRPGLRWSSHCASDGIFRAIGNRASVLENSAPQPAQKFTPAKFLTWIKTRLPLAEQVHGCYEAGPFGYGLHRDRWRRSCAIWWLHKFGKHRPAGPLGILFKLETALGRRFRFPLEIRFVLVLQKRSG